MKLKYANFDNSTIRQMHPQNPKASLLGYHFENELQMTENKFGFSIPVREEMYNGIDTVVFENTVFVHWDGGFKDDTHAEWFGDNSRWSASYFDLTNQPKYQIIEPDKEKMPKETKTPEEIYDELSRFDDFGERER